MIKPTLTQITADPSCMDDYDPNAMPVVQARKFIRDYLTPLAQNERVPLRDSLGRILSEDILSPCNVPNHDNSAMDGYAFNADDLQTGGTHLKIIGAAFAGKAFEGEVGSGECVRIMTGAVLPQGADTIAIQERVTVTDDTISFTDLPKRGMHVRYTGEDLKQGQSVLTTGHLMRPADLGLIASLGIGEVGVYRKLRVAFFFHWR